MSSPNSLQWNQAIMRQTHSSAMHFFPSEFIQKKHSVYWVQCSAGSFCLISQYWKYLDGVLRQPHSQPVHPMSTHMYHQGQHHLANCNPNILLVINQCLMGTQKSQEKQNIIDGSHLQACGNTIPIPNFPSQPLPNCFGPRYMLHQPVPIDAVALVCESQHFRHQISSPFADSHPNQCDGGVTHQLAYVLERFVHNGKKQLDGKVLVLSFEGSVLANTK